MQRITPASAYGFCLFIIFAISTLSGCLYIPVPEHGMRYAGGAIKPETQAKVIVGKSTREDVLFLLGSAQHTNKDKTNFAYTWKTIIAGVVYLGLLDRELHRHYVFCVQFDELGAVKRKYTTHRNEKVFERGLKEYEEAVNACIAGNKLKSIPVNNSATEEDGKLSGD